MLELKFTENASRLRCIAGFNRTMLELKFEANKQTADSLARFMSKMGDWYYKYLEWEDSN